MRTDFDGDMAAYWQENSTLVETELKNLVDSQFNRLQTLDTEAYKLLCRLGCFRYQDVPRVSSDALLALLWDVPEDKQRSVIKSLRNRCLVEFEKGEYWLHPIIREQGIERLKSSGEWEEVNRKAANFWTENVKSIETIEDARRAFEAYYHYFEIHDYEQSASVILKGRNNKWESNESLGYSFFRLGILQILIYVINLLFKINVELSDYHSSEIYKLLGDLYWLSGNISQAIECHNIAINKINKYFTYKDISYQAEYKITSVRLSCWINLGLCYLELKELNKAHVFLNKVNLAVGDNNLFHQSTSSAFLLAFLNSCFGDTELAYDFALKAERDIDLYSDKRDSWIKGYSRIFLALTYKNLKDEIRAFSMYNQAIDYAENSNYTQVKAKALTGLAELYRIQGYFEKALSNHSQSIELLDKIGAKCDLAEAYYQLGLTYQKMGETENSNTSFDEAIRLFNEMEAPKQVEKVENSKRGNID
ncbi:tetratricopeptide repeat protein [Anabaena sp. CCY 0017]|uniref:tetratricopeptide repeat protein n=1 Tax=Anabaena sp. CCY 0017 TaxID=3103866 RepID=UPI0039C73548